MMNPEQLAYERQQHQQEQERRRIAEEAAWRQRNPIPVLAGEVRELRALVLDLQRKVELLKGRP